MLLTAMMTMMTMMTMMMMSLVCSCREAWAKRKTPTTMAAVVSARRVCAAEGCR